MSPNDLTHHELHLLIEAFIALEAGESMNFAEMLKARVQYHGLRMLSDDKEIQALLDKLLATHRELRTNESDESYHTELYARAKARGIDLNVTDPTEGGVELIEDLLKGGQGDTKGN